MRKLLLDAEYLDIKCSPTYKFIPVQSMFE